MIRLNELFYENVERHTFVSMIYGIMDLSQMRFTFARAGHNPLILHKEMQKQTTMLCPRGLALGLERGIIFEKTLEECTLNINPGDFFVLYTDGFTEAMNKDSEEFGETRLLRIIENNPCTLAEALLQMVQKDIRRFVKKTPQHDDMTMIIARIT